MRVTNGMIINSTLNGLYNNMNALNKTYGQMTTGKKIQTVSDDPIVAGRALKLKTTVLETSQFESNVKEANSWMEITQTSLKNMNAILTEIRKKCEQAANASNEGKDISATQMEIDQLWSQLKSEANATYEGRYIFSGYKTDKPLMDGDKINAAINSDLNTTPANANNPATVSETENDKIQYEIGVNSTITVNTGGMDVVLAKMKTMFDEIRDECNVPNADSVQLNKMFGEKLNVIDGLMADISTRNSDLGSRLKRVDYVEDRLGEQKISYKTLLTNVEDVDVEEVYTNFNVQYAVYQSALQATSKIITNTLADYL